MKRIVSIIGTVLVVGSVACSAAGAATAPGIDYGGVRDAASEEDLNGSGLLLDDELAAPRIMSAVPVDTSDDDEFYVTRGRDLDRLVSRDAASEDDQFGSGPQGNALSVTDQLFDDELAAPRIASAVPVNTNDEDELYVTRGRDLDRLVSRDAASEDDQFGSGPQGNALSVTDQLFDDELAAPRIMSAVPVDPSDEDELYATRGRDFDRLVSRDAASEEANL